MRGADIVASALKAEGVEFVAGVTGGSTMAMYDAIHSAGIKILVCRHERGAADIADGYARATGKPGVALVEMGPGAINAMAGIANSYPDSVPVILLMGGVSNKNVGRNAYQENDLMDIFRTVTKWEMTVPLADRIPEAMRRAFSVVTAPRPRPVALEIPSNVAGGNCDENLVYEPLRQKRFRFRADAADINRAVDLLLKSKNPMILAGAGVISSGAHAELIAFAERLGIPVAISLAGKSAFPDHHPLALGLGALQRGRYNTKQAAYCADKADVVLAIGAAFRQQATKTFAPLTLAKKIIQVDVDPTEFNKSYMTDVAVLGDAQLVLQDMLDAVGSSVKNTFWGGVEALKQEIAVLKKATREGWMADLTSDAVPINPHRVVWELMQVLDPAKSLIVHDSGSPRGLICYHWECPGPKSFMAFGNQSCMGWSVGAAIGAKLGAPEKEVVVLLGDGSFGMSGMEINTAVRHNIKTTFVVINNDGFDLTRVQAGKVLNKSPDIPWMELSGDVAKVAEGLGAYAQRVEKPQDLRAAFERAFAAKETAVVEVRTMKGAPEPTRV